VGRLRSGRASCRMRAMLLAAGLGTRLRPLTDELPKALVPVGGKAPLVRSIEWLRRYGVTELTVNLHHLPGRVTAVLGDGEALGVRIDYSHEAALRGTAGALAACRARFEGARFLVVYADN